MLRCTSYAPYVTIRYFASPITELTERLAAAEAETRTERDKAQQAEAARAECQSQCDEGVRARAAEAEVTQRREEQHQALVQTLNERMRACS